MFLINAILYFNETYLIIFVGIKGKDVHFVFKFVMMKQMEQSKIGGNQMKISTKGRYALRLMLDIAQNSSDKPVSVKEIASRQDISDKYLEQIISMLNGAGYVRSIRGPQGGYLLRKKPEEYTVGMILRLTEGTLSPVPCVEEDALPCEREEGCATIKLWRKLNDAISGVVDHVTLADLMEWSGSGADSYCI